MNGKFPPWEAPLRDGSLLLLREAEEDDGEEVLRFLNRVGGESDNLLFGKDGFSMPLEQERAFLQSLRAAQRSIMLLGFAEGQLACVSSLSCFDRRERTAHRAEAAVCVRRSFWGRGVEILQLDVRADNDRAISLYRALGFEQVGRYRNFFKIGGEYFDAYSMNLYLDRCRG